MKSLQLISMVKSHMDGWRKVDRTEAQCEIELSGLATALIAAFSKGSTMMPPTIHNVASIVVDEMSKWTTTSVDFEALADRLIRYFSIYYSQPAQHEGLPGNPLMVDLAVGRRSIAKSALMNSTTGIVLPS